MRQSLRHSTPLRLAAVCVVALALFVKLLIAPGMMPVADAGGIRITLCTGSGPVETVLDLSGKHHDGKSQAAHEPCAFELLGMGGLAAQAHELPVATIASVRVAAGLPSLPARAPPVAAPPPATGPPSLA